MEIAQESATSSRPVVTVGSPNATLPSSVSVEKKVSVVVGGRRGGILGILVSYVPFLFTLLTHYYSLFLYYYDYYYSGQAV